MWNLSIHAAKIPHSPLPCKANPAALYEPAGLLYERAVSGRTDGQICPRLHALPF